MTQSITRKRWNLITLWVAALVLAIVAAGAVVYHAARASVEKYVQLAGDMLPNAGSEPAISFGRARLSSESWVIFEFDVDLDPESASREYRNWIWEWGLREWDTLRVKADILAVP